MKTTAIHTLFKLATLLAVAAPLAATGGALGWSDETLRGNINEIDTALAKLRPL